MMSDGRGSGGSVVTGHLSASSDVIRGDPGPIAGFFATSDIDMIGDWVH